MKWIKRIAIAAAVLLVLALALPFLIGLDRYIPEAEKLASDRLKEPVTIKSMGFGLLPVPHATLGGINVGAGSDLAVGSVRVTPDLWSLLGSNRVVRSIEIDGLVLTQKAIDRIPVWTKTDDSAPKTAGSTLRVNRIRLDNAVVKTTSASFGPFDAQVNLGDTGEPEDASISTRDGKLKVNLKPGASNTTFVLDVHAKGWTSPVGPPVVLDELDIKGTATLGDATLTQISAKLYGGTVEGKATVGWRKRLQFNGNLDISHLELKDLAPMFSPKTHVSGRLNAKPVFSASAADVAELKESIRLETPFSVQDGIIHGVDIQKAATSVITRGPTGGETRFDQLSGNFAMEHSAYHLTKLNVASGALAVDGDVTISQKKELSGRINTQVKALGVSTGIPLNVAGTLDTPLLYPTGATLTGAAVGTALMGPGVGTTVGAKAGGFVEGLFGKKPADKPKK